MKFKGILMCTDLDGTLLRNDKTISKENSEAIEYFKSQGGLFTFVTGRMPCYVGDICQRVNPNCAYVCGNGGAVYDEQNEKYLWHKEIDKSVLELARYIDENVEDIGVQLYTLDHVYFATENPAMERFRIRTKVPNLKIHYNDMNKTMTKVVFGDLNSDKINRVAELLDKHARADEFDFVRSERTLYEILPKGVNKGCGMMKLCELLGIDINKTIAIGDFNNDIEMIKCAKFGVAVENATDDTKAVADYISCSNQEHAIAHVIDMLDCGKIKI